jgi:signal transduction histidine kinase/PAS domain-containing protein
VPDTQLLGVPIKCVIAGADVSLVKAREASSYQWWAPRLVLVVAVVVVGLGSSGVLAVALQASEVQAADQALDRRAELLNGATEVETRRYVDLLAIVADGAGAFDELTAARFAQLTASLRAMRLAGASSVAFLVPATDAEVGTVQARWRSRGAPDLELTSPASERGHIFSVFSESLDGSTRRVGIDAARAVAPARALDEARTSNVVTVSDTYQLLLDRDLPPDQQQQSFVLTAPVLGLAVGGGARPFLGWVTMGLRGQDFMGATLARVAQHSLDVTLFAHNADGAVVRVAGLRAPTEDRRDVHRVIEVAVAQRHWQLQVEAVGASLPGRSPLPATGAGAGAALTLALGVLVAVLATSRSRAQRRVEAATAELQGAEHRARGQADLLEAILNSISDGVAVVDEDGEFLMHNPAGRLLVGVQDRAGTGSWQNHYGLFMPDGQTPFPTEELPLVLAMAGESTDQIEMVIRNPTWPDGAPITVSGRPLDNGAGPSGGVAVFHDIAAQKQIEDSLRHERDHSETVAAVASTIAASGVHTGAIAETITAELANRIGDFAAYVSVEPSTGLLHVTAIAGRDPEVTNAGGLILAREGRFLGEDTLVAQAARRATTTVTDVTDSVAFAATVNGAYIAFARKHPIHHLLHVPVHGADGTLGVVMLIRFHREPFDRRDLDLVEDVAARAGHAITSARLFEQKDSAEQALRTSQARLEQVNADLRGFAAIASHDLRAPLARISGFSQLLLLKAEQLDSQGVESLEYIDESARHLAALIQSLLDLALVSDQEMQRGPIDLRDTVTRVLDHLDGAVAASSAQIHRGSMPTVSGDAGLLERLVQNLMSNALKYQPEGQIPDITITAGATGTDGWTTLTVADNGIGIDPAQTAAVFEPFRRLGGDQTPGTGLGLAVCERIVHRHGGQISVAPNTGGGTIFSCTLPLASHRTVRSS